MRRLVLVCAAVLAGCGSGDGGEPAPSPVPTDEASPTEITAPAPHGTAEGRLVVTQSGCLACHRFGNDGNTGPGPDLTTVGARLSRAELRRAMLDPKAPMPSYRGLEPARLDALVDYLAALR